MTTPTETLNPIVSYYDTSTKSYWIQDNQKQWIEVNEGSLKRHLRNAGLSQMVGKNENVSEVESAIIKYQLESNIAYAGGLSGYTVGIHQVLGRNILVTYEPKLPESKQGPWNVLKEFIFNLLHEDEVDQKDYLYGWILCAYDALKRHIIRPGQCLAFAGPKSCGKSLLQNLITVMLGGRSAKPYRYMSGMTEFNGELFEAEHLMIEDEAGSSDLRERRKFGNRIKDFTVNEVQSCHGKNRNAVQLKPFWRLSISLNDEDENLMVLPPIDESLSDKLILLRAHSHDMPMPTDTPDQRADFWGTLVGEIPGMLHWLENEWLCPDELRCPRFGIKSYMHPELVEAIDAMSPEIRLLNLIDAVFFKDDIPLGGSYELTAVEIEKRLIASDWSYEAKRILNWNNATGTYLGRLASKKPQRISYDRSNSKRLWTIKMNGHLT